MYNRFGGFDWSFCKKNFLNQSALFCNLTFSLENIKWNPSVPVSNCHTHSFPLYMVALTLPHKRWVVVIQMTQATSLNKICTTRPFNKNLANPYLKTATIYFLIIHSGFRLTTVSWYWLSAGQHVSSRFVHMEATSPMHWYKSLLASYLSHWPEPVTWPSPGSRWEGLYKAMDIGRPDSSIGSHCYSNLFHPPSQ